MTSFCGIRQGSVLLAGAKDTNICMGDSRICSRGFPGSFVVHGALARRKFFIITTPTFILIVRTCCAYHDIIVKDSPKVVL